MKKLLTIFSFILLLFISLVVMFCSSKEITGGDTGGNDGWDAPPNTIIQDGSYTYNLNGDKWELIINASDRTVSIKSNNIEIKLKDNKYDNIFNGDKITIKTIYDNDIIFNPSKPETITIDGKTANTGSGTEQPKPDPNPAPEPKPNPEPDPKPEPEPDPPTPPTPPTPEPDPDPDTSIGKDYKYYFVLETHASEVSGGSDYKKQVDYTNSRLFLNKNESLEIQLNEKTKLKVNNINTDKGDLKYINWDVKNKILTIKSSVNTFVYNFTDKTVMIDTVKGYLVDESNLKYNVEKPSGWYIFSIDSRRIEKKFGYVFGLSESYVKNKALLYYDCNPTNQSVYLIVMKPNKNYSSILTIDWTSEIGVMIKKTNDGSSSMSDVGYDFNKDNNKSYISSKRIWYHFPIFRYHELFGEPTHYAARYYKKSGSLKKETRYVSNYINLKMDDLVLYYDDVFDYKQELVYVIFTNTKIYSKKFPYKIPNDIKTPPKYGSYDWRNPVPHLEDFTGDKKIN